jgi:hypothetical protein
MKFNEIVVAPFVGIDFFDRDVSPPSADTGAMDDEIGIVVGARIDNSGVIRSAAGNVLFSIDGSWASTNNSYYVETEVGYDFGMFTIGPEGAALGSDDFTAWRIGGHASANIADDATVKIGVGYQFNTNDGPFGNGGSSGGDTPYGDITFSIAF